LAEHEPWIKLCRRALSKSQIARGSVRRVANYGRSIIQYGIVLYGNQSIPSVSQRIGERQGRKAIEHLSRRE
jgi:hypothetical protein